MGGFFLIWTQESRRANCIRFPYIIVIDDKFFIKFLPSFHPVSSTSVLVSWLVVAEIVFVFVFFPRLGVESGAILAFIGEGSAKNVPWIVVLRHMWTSVSVIGLHLCPFDFQLRDKLSPSHPHPSVNITSNITVDRKEVKEMPYLSG